MRQVVKDMTMLNTSVKRGNREAWTQCKQVLEKKTD